jgi:hypothetical protein
MVPRGESQLRSLQRHRAHSANSAKRSYRSHSSSFEADDERSSSADHDMGPEAAVLRDDPSQYPGEDTRLTSRKELSGWYAYGFAAEVFVICGVGEFRDPFEVLFLLQTYGVAVVRRAPGNLPHIELELSADPEAKRWDCRRFMLIQLSRFIHTHYIRTTGTREWGPPL